MNSEKPAIVVGVEPGRAEAVVGAAARFANRLGAELVCASVDVSRYTIDVAPDGSVVALSLDPDVPDEVVERVEPELRAEITAALEGSDVPWTVRALAGGTAQELARLAEELDAELIVVGTRAPGFVGSVREFFNGSVAAQLAHRQRRPVLVVPLDPVGHEAALPWDDHDA